MRGHKHRLAVVAVLAVAALAVGATGGVAADKPGPSNIRTTDAVDPDDAVWTSYDRNATITVYGYSLTDWNPAAVSVSGPGWVRIENSTNQVTYSVSPEVIGVSETVEVLYNGSPIDTVTVEIDSWHTKGIEIDASKLAGAKHVNISIPANKTTYHGLSAEPGVNNTGRTLSVGLSAADADARPIFKTVSNNSTTVDLTTINKSDDFLRDWPKLVGDLPLNGQVTLVTSDAVESVTIDGETVYNGSSDAPLGGGGSGGGGVPLIMILIGAAAVIYLGTRS